MVVTGVNFTQQRGVTNLPQYGVTFLPKMGQLLHDNAHVSWKPLYGVNCTKFDRGSIFAQN